MHKVFTRFSLPVLMVLALINALLLFVHRVMTNGDNLDYLFIAGAVNAGHWTEPFHWRFPVGYPFWLALVSWSGGGVIDVNPLSVSTMAIYGIKLVGVVMAPLAVATVYGWARVVATSATVVWMIALLIATTQVWAPVYSIIGSEPYFLVLVWLALWGWEKALLAEHRGMAHDPIDGGKVSPTQSFPPYNEDSVVGREWSQTFAPIPPGACGTWLTVACGASLGAIMFRQLGLAIPLAVVIAVVVRAILDGEGVAWRPLIGALAVGFAGVVLMLLNTSHLGQLAGAGLDQQSILAAKWALLRDNFIAYRMTIPYVMLPKILGEDGVTGRLGMGWLGTVAALLIGILILAGLWRSLRDHRAGLVSALFVIINIGIILVWPYRDARFFVPLLPALWFLVIRGADWLGTKLPVAAFRRLGWVIGLLFMLAVWQQATSGFAGIKNLRAMYDLRALPAWHPARYEITGELDFADHLACGIWLAENARSGAVIFAEKAKFIELTSGHPVNYLGFSLLDGTLMRVAEDLAEAYVVQDVFPESAGYGRAKLKFKSWRSQPDAPHFEPIYHAPYGAIVYRAGK